MQLPGFADAGSYGLDPLRGRIAGSSAHRSMKVLRRKAAAAGIADTMKPILLERDGWVQNEEAVLATLDRTRCGLA